MYAAGLTSVANRNWRLLGLIVNGVSIFDASETSDRTLPDVLRSDKILEHYTVTQLGYDPNRIPAPASDFMRITMEQYVVSSLFGKDEYEQSFDVFEFALTLATTLQRRDRFPYVGGFVYRQRALHAIIRSLKTPLSGRDTRTLIEKTFGLPRDEVKGALQLVDERLTQLSLGRYGGAVGSFAALVGGD